MLDEKRIKTAKANARDFQIQSLYSRQEFKQIIFDTYMRNHRESLLVANDVLKQEISPLWVVVTSYYSMFYIANAALYKIGFKIGNRSAHAVTYNLMVVHIRDKLKDFMLTEYEEISQEALAITDNLIENLAYEKEKRSRFQYETTDKIKISKAQTSLQRAKEFGIEMERFIDSLKNK